MVNSFFRAWEGNDEEGEEFALWWTTAGQPWTADSEAAQLEALIGQARWAGECSVKQASGVSHHVVKDGRSTAVRPWVTVCALPDAVPEGWLREVAQELVELPLESLGSNTLDWTDDSGATIRTRDGAGVRGELVVDGVTHDFRWFNPEARLEPGAAVAAEIGELMDALRQHALSEVTARADRLGSSR